MRKLNFIIPILCLMLLIGCASQSVTTPDQMTPKQRATFVMNLYSNAYDNYLVLAYE